MAAEKLKGLALALPIALKAKGKGEDEKPEEEDDDEGGDVEHSPEQLEAAQGLIDAVKAGDSKGVCTAFQALWMLYDDDTESDEKAPESGRY